MSENQRERKQATTKTDLTPDHFVRKRVGEKVHHARLRLGLSQEELCLRAGLNRTYLSDIERGEGNATLTILTKISGALDISLADLLSGVESKKKNPANLLLIDTPPGQARIKRLLEGHNIVCSQHLRDAKQHLEEQTFDLVIGGLNFADGRIFDLLRLSRITEHNGKTPFLCFREQSLDQINPFLRQAVSISCAALGACIFLESEQYSRTPEGELQLRRDIEHWLPADKRLWTS